MFREKKSTVIPGATERECGNAADHDLEGAKKVARECLDGVLNQIRDEINTRMKYPEEENPDHI